ncbi:recombinase family protein [Kitasatospora sp. NPDC057198]|uniref:recombinase family protein n=1 Tax=Kitasatospora sp. NPDC057198 TaxID=3346046 RepID=UPI003626E5F0
MARKATEPVKYVDLLLRKSQAVRGTATQDILSLKAQEARGRAWAKKNQATVRKIFRENLSAYKLTVKRPEFDAAVRALLEGESDCLWAYDSSRYTRKGAGDVLKVLDTPGKRLVFDINGLDTERPEDRRRIIEDAERDREYSRVLSEKVRDTKAAQREEGKWLAFAPIGLKVTKKRKLKHDKLWPMIERIHNEAAEGASNRQIAKGLSIDGYRGPRGGPVLPSLVGNILRDPVYLGWQIILVKGRPQIYVNAKGKKVRVFAKGVEGIPQETWDKHRRIAANIERRKNLPTGERSKPAEHSPGSGLIWCEGGGRNPKTGHLATVHSHSFRCSRANAGMVDCPEPASAMRTVVVKALAEALVTKLSTADPMDPTLLAVAENWVELSQPEESQREVEARGQLKLAEEAVARIDRLEAAGAYPGRDGEATYIKMRRSAVEDLEDARREWEALAKPMADISVLTDPARCTQLWEGSDDIYRGKLLRLAIDKVFLKKAPYQGARFNAERLHIVWKTPRGWEASQEKGQQRRNKS